MEFNYSALEVVIHDEDATIAVPRIMEQVGATRALLLGSSNLSKGTQGFSRLRESMGDRHVGLFDNIGTHSPRKDVFRVLQVVSECNPDVLVSLGGGSIIDTAKAVQLAIDLGITDQKEMLAYAKLADGSCGPKWGRTEFFPECSKIRQIAVPTTLSGAEFSNNAGILDSVNSAKEGYWGPRLCPQAIVYDPRLALHTPEWLWLSTAIRSLDHAIEGYCSNDTSPYLDAHFLKAMELFATSLPMVKSDAKDIEAKALSQQAVWLACCGLGTVSHGASHGIGYILGSYCGVPHGYTSCVMLPAVLEWNKTEFKERQTSIAYAIGRPKLPAGIAVRSLVEGLGLPSSLQQVGVKEEQLDEIAERAIKHPVVRKNPRNLETKEQVREILNLAWT